MMKSFFHAQKDNNRKKKIKELKIGFNSRKIQLLDVNYFLRVLRFDNFHRIFRTKLYLMYFHLKAPPKMKLEISRNNLILLIHQLDFDF